MRKKTREGSQRKANQRRGSAEEGGAAKQVLRRREERKTFFSLPLPLRGQDLSRARKRVSRRCCDRRSNNSALNVIARFNRPPSGEPIVRGSEGAPDSWRWTRSILTPSSKIVLQHAESINHQNRIRVYIYPSRSTLHTTSHNTLSLSLSLSLSPLSRSPSVSRAGRIAGDVAAKERERER